MTYTVYYFSSLNGSDKFHYVIKYKWSIEYTHKITIDANIRVVNDISTSRVLVWFFNLMEERKNHSSWNTYKDNNITSSCHTTMYMLRGEKSQHLCGFPYQQHQEVMKIINICIMKCNLAFKFIDVIAVISILWLA